MVDAFLLISSTVFSTIQKFQKVGRALSFDKNEATKQLFYTELYYTDPLIPSPGITAETNQERLARSKEQSAFMVVWNVLCQEELLQVEKEADQILRLMTDLEEKMETENDRALLKLGFFPECKELIYHKRKRPGFSVKASSILLDELSSRKEILNLFKDVMNIACWRQFPDEWRGFYFYHLVTQYYLSPFNYL